MNMRIKCTSLVNRTIISEKLYKG